MQGLLGFGALGHSVSFPARHVMPLVKANRVSDWIPASWLCRIRVLVFWEFQQDTDFLERQQSNQCASVTSRGACAGTRP
jgi:hypothetical protein